MNIRQKVLLTGATGFIGRVLSVALLAKGWKLVILGRRPEANFRKEFTLPCEYFQWAEPSASPPPVEALNIDAVINLMGEPIADRRWTEGQKTKLRDSRILSTRNLVSALRAHNPNLKSFVSSSAIGYYGDSGDQPLSENSPPARNFLGQLCEEWELEAQKAPGRCVQIRTGIVLASQGGALAKMAPLFKNGLGGQLSTGRQWMSWIHISDLVSIFMEALENPKIRGPLNAVAPTPVTNKEFTETLAKQFKVKAFFNVPKLVLKLTMGEMAQILLVSQRVKPQALMALGFKFKFTTLKETLLNLYDRTYRVPSSF